MKRIAIFILAVGGIQAQTITPSVSPSTVGAKGTVTLSLTFTPGTTPTAATQWSYTPPVGFTMGAWSIGPAATAAGKQLYCAGPTCVLAANDTNSTTTGGTTPIGAGVIATVILTASANVRGSQTQTVTGTLSSDPTGSGLTTTGGAASVTVLSPFDLNGDGAVNAADFAIALSQALGQQSCGSADFNGDGVCNVLDLVLLAADATLSNP